MLPGRCDVAQRLRGLAVATPGTRKNIKDNDVTLPG
jgi:hypothetical protein